MSQVEKIAQDVAQEELGKWLDKKRINEKRRGDLEKAIDQLTGMIQYGNLTIQPDGELHYTLLWPIKDSEERDVCTMLKFKSRLTVIDLQNRMKGVKAGDADARLTATIAALTGEPIGILNKLDTEDNRTAEAIAVFFL